MEMLTNMDKERICSDNLDQLLENLDLIDLKRNSKKELVPAKGIHFASHLYIVPTSG